MAAFTRQSALSQRSMGVFKTVQDQLQHGLSLLSADAVTLKKNSEQHNSTFARDTAHAGQRNARPEGETADHPRRHVCVCATTWGFSVLSTELRCHVETRPEVLALSLSEMGSRLRERRVFRRQRKADKVAPTATRNASRQMLRGGMGDEG